MPYEYRHMTPEQREAIVRLRTAKGHPLHAPPHPLKERAYYLLSAANFEHRPIMASPARRTEFQKRVLDKLQESGIEIRHGFFAESRPPAGLCADIPEAIQRAARRHLPQVESGRRPNRPHRVVQVQ